MTNKTLAPWTVLRGHAGEVQALDFLGQQHLLSGDSDGCVRLWDLQTRRTIQQASLHPTQSGILSLQVTCKPSGSPVLISAGRDGRVLIHDITPSGIIDSDPSYGIPATTYGFCRPHTTGFLPPQQQPDFAPDQGVPTAVTAPPSKPAETPLPVQADGWLVACSGPAPGHVYLWDTRTPIGNPPAITLPAPDIAHAGHDAASTHQAISAEGINSNSNAGALAKTVGQTMSLQFLSSHLEGQGKGGSVAHPASGQSPPLLVGYESGSLALWDIRQSAWPTGLVVRAHSEPVLCCAAIPGPLGMAVTGGADTAVRFWTIRQGGPSSEGRSLQGTVTHTLPAEGVGHAACRADGRVVATAGWDSKVRLYSGKSSHKPLAILRHHTKEVTSVTWAPGPHLRSVVTGIVSDYDDNSLQPWSLRGASQERLGLLASGSRDTSVALWLLYEWAGDAQQACE